MLYPLYEYYSYSNLNLSEIISDYLTNFYLKKNDYNKVKKVKKKILDSSKIASIDAFSIQKKVVPNHIDFVSAVNEVVWFILQSNETQALGVLIAADEWSKRVNNVYHFGTPKEVRDKAIKIFKKYSIYGEMSKEQFDKMINQEGHNRDDNIKAHNIEKNNSLDTENFKK